MRRVYKILTSSLDWLVLPRDTLELSKLNDIWGRFNDGVLTGEQTREELYKINWKYHKEKVALLVAVTELL